MTIGVTRQTVDQIRVAVLQRRLESITEQMASTLIRTTRSPLFNQVGDFAAGLMDAEGQASPKPATLV